MALKAQSIVMVIYMMKNRVGLSATNEVMRSRPDIGPGVGLATNQTYHRSSDTVTITRRFN